MADPAATLGPLAAWMRDVGASYVKLPDGTELELGAPPVQRDGDTAPTPAQQYGVWAAEMRDHCETKFLHVGGCRHTDDQHEQMYGGAPALDRDVDLEAEDDS